MNYLNFVSLASLASLSCISNNLYSQAKQKPNILIAIADDISYPHMSAYGCKWVNTPGFDSVAKQGVLFNNAYTSNAKSAPSRACILTGRNTWQLEDACNHMCYFPAKFKTFPEILAKNGYHVGYAGKGWAPGIALNEDGSKRDLLVKAYKKNKLIPPTTCISNDDYAENFKQFLAANKDDKPFFFWYGGWEPHRAYEYASGLKYGKRLEEIDKVFDFWVDNKEVRTDMLDYAFELEYFDKQLQKILTTLKEKGKLDNTLIIVTADNGMPFPRIKGQDYEFSNHLPLTIMWKDGIKYTGRTVNDFVSFIDIAPTILELAGVDKSKNDMQSITGKSISEILYSKKSGTVCKDRDHVIMGKERHDIGRPHQQGYPIRGIRKGDYLFIKNFKTDRFPCGNPITGYPNCDAGPTKTELLKTRGTDNDIYYQLTFGKRDSIEFYNVKKDPCCMKNLAYDKKYDKIKNKMKELLFKELKEQQDPRILGNGDVFDNYRVYPEIYMDYYEKIVKGEKVPTLHWMNKSDYQKSDD